MQKENPVIKNYILSSKKRVLKENSPCLNKINFSEISLYHLLSKQNKALIYLFLSEK